VSGTNRESNHWTGNGVDFGMVANGGINRILSQCAREVGGSNARERAL
jgi:hypothetical protein